MALRIFFFISLLVSVTARHHANHTNTNRTTRPQTRVGFIRSAYKYDRGLLNWVITGVVKVWHEGRWGTICDDSFNNRAANVICRSMGYRQGLHYGSYHHFKHPIYPGQRNMTIWLDDVRCTGGERDIGQCRHNGWGRHNCGHSEDVTIGCLTPCVGCTVAPQTAPQPSQPPHANHTNTNGTTRPFQRTPVSFIRSVSSYDRSIGGMVRSGVVKVYHNGRWGTICDDEFDNIDATVICNSMGYWYGYHDRSNHRIKHPGQRNMTIWLDNVRCTGLERDIGQCRHNGWGRHNCGHREDVIIGCHNVPSRNVTAQTTPPPPPPTQQPQPVNTTVGWAVRPVSFNHGGRYPVTTTAGIVKVYHNGRWGTICDDNFSHGSAQVLCRKMGYRYGVHYRPSFTVDGRPRNGMPIWLDNFNCRGHEQNIDDCDHNPWGQHDCRHREDALIGCSNNPNLLRQTHHHPIIPWTPRPWTQEPHRPWTHRPWTHRPWTEPHYTRSYNDYVTYTDVRQLRYQVMRFLRTVYRGFAEGLSNAAQGFHSRLEYLTRP